ncbi:MAG: UDP-N-acetylmuramate dehydrogenase [Thermodesulfovibrionales bacterium]
MEDRRRDITKIEVSTNSGTIVNLGVESIDNSFRMKEEWKDIFSEVFSDVEVRFDEPMAGHTSLRIGGPADIFLIPHDISSLKNMLTILKRSGIPFLPLGRGTNILIRDGGIEGAVISFRSFKKMEIISEDDEIVNIYVESGTLLQRLIQFSKEKGYSGIEGLIGIPGSVGGAICGNAGAFGYEMKDVLSIISIIGQDGVIRRLKSKDIKFGYRSSNISSNELILSAEVVLKKDKIENVSSRVEDFLRKKRDNQPLSETSAGCVFKNLPKISAGKLIDEAGCKGLRIGDVEVSRKHANFFINRGRASASDFIRLMETVKLKVKEISDIELEPEIRVIGRE